MPAQIIRPAAYAWIEDDGRVLLCRLSEAHHSGQWTLPGGGLEFGEDPATGCRREVQEETGLEVALGSVLWVDSLCTQVRPELAAREFPRLHGVALPPGPARMHSLRVVYRARIIRGTLTPEADGSTDQVEWVAVGDILRRPVVELVTATLTSALSE